MASVSLWLPFCEISRGNTTEARISRRNTEFAFSECSPVHPPIDHREKPNLELIRKLSRGRIKLLEEYILVIR